MGDLVPVIAEAINSAVASEVVMPRPSWPVASQRVLSLESGPMRGSLSGVAARKPVQTRRILRALMVGMYSDARVSMAVRIAWSMLREVLPYWREEPMRICP